jgi:hypothetical protein
MIGRFTAYDLKDGVELDDTCPGPPIPVYHKSLLYFVARALEPGAGQYETPMVGLTKHVPAQYAMPDGTVRRLLDVMGGPHSLVEAPNNEVEADGRSKADGHGAFDDDEDTMTSVLLRILGTNDLASVIRYPKGGMPSRG